MTHGADKWTDLNCVGPVGLDVTNIKQQAIVYFKKMFI